MDFEYKSLVWRPGMAPIAQIKQIFLPEPEWEEYRVDVMAWGAWMYRYRRPIKDEQKAEK